jgi:hypothetical protein
MKLTIKSVVLTFAILVAAHIASAQSFTKPESKPLNKTFWATTSIYFSGVAADLVSSHNRPELNGLLRNAQGGVSAPRAILFASVPYGISLWLDHKHHSTAGNVVRLFAGAGHWDVAVHNWRTR